MSYDPSASGPDLPPEYDPAAQAPGGLEGIKARVQPAAIALIVVGVLNLLLMVFQVGRTVLVAMTSPQELAKEIDESFATLEKSQILPKGFLDAYKQQQKDQSPEDFKKQALLMGVISTALGLLISLLPLLGGIRMLSLRSYALGIAGAISAAIPCLSCGGCCCFGEIIGIWAFVVLLNPDVRAAFQ